MSHSIVWVDIPAVDLDRAIAFYSAVLGGEVTKQSGPGFSIGLFPHQNNDVGGCVHVSAEYGPSAKGPLVYLNVEGRLEAAVAAAVAGGGSVLTPVHSMGQHGNRAIILDSEGNRVALHSMNV